MARIVLNRPDHPAVAATLLLFNERNGALAGHVDGCEACTAHPPMRYRNCETGRGLATAMVAARTAVINADAAASATHGEG